jgi:hypothetical protein
MDMKSARYTAIALAYALCAVSAVAQEFQTVTPAGLGGSGFVPIAAGSNTFWAFSAPHNAIYQFDPVSQSMQPQIIFGGVSPWTFALGGGSAIQNDEKWVVNGQIWRYDTPTGILQLISSDNRVEGVEVGPGYVDSCHPYEVWTTYWDSPTQNWLAKRYNFCTKVFDSIAVNTAVGGPSRLSTGGGEVWGLNDANQVLRFDPVSNALKLMTGTLAHIAVGVDGVWGTDASGNVYEYNPVNPGWERINGSLVYIAAGANGLWGINSQHIVFRYDASERTFFAVNSAHPSFGELVVGTGAGVWETDTSGDIQAFVTP